MQEAGDGEKRRHGEEDSGKSIRWTYSVDVWEGYLIQGSLIKPPRGVTVAYEGVASRRTTVTGWTQPVEELVDGRYVDRYFVDVG